MTYMSKQIDVSKTDDRRALIQGLREFADFLENTTAPMPCGAQFDAFIYTKEDLGKTAKDIGGKFEKFFCAEWAGLRRRFGPIRYDVNVKREQVCRLVVTGTKEVPERVIPETVIPAHIEDITTWECDEPILEGSRAPQPVYCATCDIDHDTPQECPEHPDYEPVRGLDRYPDVKVSDLAGND